MAYIISGRSGRLIYAEVLDAVRRTGVKKESRAGLTRELSDVVIALRSPMDALAVDCGRNLNPRIAAAEALQLIGGFSDPEWMCRISSQFKKFREDLIGGTPWFHGAYGLRISIANQLNSVIHRLRNMPNTRQAVITIWYPEMDTEEGHLDYPCTVALGFSRSGENLSELNMRVTMRSNDAWLGLPYDMFQFTQLQLTLCNVLGLRPGTYTHTAWSLHLYEHDVEKSHSVDVPQDSTNPLWRVMGLGYLGATSQDLCSRAMYIKGPNTTLTTPTLTASERWYSDVLLDT